MASRTSRRATGGDILDLLVNPQARETALTRSKIVSTLRREFENRGFIEVETPVLQLQAGGALARPFMTHHNALGLDVYLRIALELHLKRLIVGGLDRVFEIGRTFRNEGVSPKHNPEFTMLEAYVAYADYFDIMDLVEEVVTEVVMQVAGSPSLTYRDKPLDFSGPWPRIDMLDSIAAACGVEFTMDMPKEDARKRADELDIDVDGTWGVGKIAMEVFERHVEPDLWEPTFVTGHPVEVSPLAREHRDGGGITERFEFFAGGWEIANAFSELNDPIEQRRRFRGPGGRESGRRRRGPLGGRGLSAGSRVRHATDRRSRRRGGQADDDSHGPGDDPRGHPVPAYASGGLRRFQACPTRAGACLTCQ